MFSPLPAMVYVPFAASNSTLPLCSTFPTSPVPSKIPTVLFPGASAEITRVHLPNVTLSINATTHHTAHIFRLPPSIEPPSNVSVNLGRPAHLVNAPRRPIFLRFGFLLYLELGAVYLLRSEKF